MNTRIFFSVIIVCLYLTGCKNKTEDAAEEHEVLGENVVEMNDDQYKMAGIELDTICHKVLSNTIKVNGLVNVSPQNLATITAKLGGTVKSTTLVQGSPVAKGQVIAVMENFEFIELQQNYLESKNLLELAEADYNRQKELFKENVNSEKTYQQAFSDYKNLKSKVFAYEQKLTMLGIDVRNLQEDKISSAVSIISPISGYVKTANVNIGKYMKPEDVMFEIVNNQNLTLELTLFEKDINQVSIGQKIQFTSPNTPNDVQYAKIYQVGKSIGDDKTVKIYATVDNQDKNLLPGMYINAFIETDNNATTALPSESVLTFDDKNYIFIYEGSKKEKGKNMTLFKMIEVQKGVTNNNFTEVILPEGFDIINSKVVFKGAYNLLSALKNAGDMAC